MAIHKEQSSESKLYREFRWANKSTLTKLTWLSFLHTILAGQLKLA